MHHKARLATIAVVGLLVGASPALAEKAPTDSGRQMTVDRTTTAVEITTTVSIPTIEAAGSNIDGDTLKAILSGKAPDRIADLSTLSATSIHIPEVRVEVAVPAGPKMGDGKFIYTYKDIDLEGVKNGVAQSAVVGTAEQSGGDGISMSFGKMSAADFDVGGVLAIYGMVPSLPDQPLKTIYSDFSIADGKVAAHDVQCDVGSLTTKSFKARPLKTSFADLMKLVSAPELQKGDASLSPDLVSKLLGFYIDLFDGVEIAPMTLASIDCAGKSPEGEIVKVKMGPVTMGAFGHEQYPSIEVKNLDVTAANGQMSFGSFTLKSFDLSGPLGVLKTAMAQGPVSSDWFTAHVRDLIPAFTGFAFSDVKIDVPDKDHPSQQVQASLADFDLSLSNYLGGVPTTIATGAHHFVYAVPPAVAGVEDDMAGLRQLGIANLDLGFDLKLHRDAQAKTIVVDEASVTGANMGSAAVSGLIGGAIDTLFTGGSDEAMAAAMALTVKSLKLDASDAGLGDIILKRAGGEQGMDLQTTRASMSAVAQGVIIASLGATPSATALSGAVSKFIAGANTIAVTATANSPDGLTTADFDAAKTDPKGFSSKITIDATAK